MDSSWRSAGLVLCLAAGSAVAQPASDTQSLRREIDAMKADYEQRIKALEQRLQAAEDAQKAQPPTAAPATAAAPGAPLPPTAIAPPPQPVPSAQASTQSLLETSLILSGQYTRTSRDPADYRIRGFSLPPDAQIGPGTRGFSLAESELALTANIDPWFRGQANIAFEPDNSVSIEEAYVQTTSLGNGLTLKAGRFFSSVGYLNSQHAHTWDFADAPLAYQAMLGTQFNDDGLQVAWLAPTDQFFEIRGELGRGRSYPGTDSNRNGAGMSAISAHTGGDIGESQSWRAGLSYLNAKATNQDLSAFDPVGNPITNSFSGSTNVWIADAVWKWAPNGNATRTNFKLQGEYLHATRDGSLVADTTGAASSGSYRQAQSGWYLQGVYQFMPRWRVGLRTERLGYGTPDYGANAGLVGLDSGSPSKQTLMVDWNPSEFSRWRVQVAQDRARPGNPDWQWTLQYQMSLGVHGAHSY
ncbi:carbohydrate porin [Ramlibacter sp. G-1-2-2]|uniref:Carbohydrate porin n=1 Tax=Ramlibacter agri TaxID=2728837 RepID=A0A848H317_9BURK|nr:outer membrane beta-barrel protein [Ramlibacter agri]NML42188.1 carbohydrate porin [Ramlibacter agri]